MTAETVFSVFKTLDDTQAERFIKMVKTLEKPKVKTQRKKLVSDDEAIYKLLKYLK